MSERYGVATFDELATAPIPGQARWHTIRRTLGWAMRLVFGRIRRCDLSPASSIPIRSVVGVRAS